jgi:hypothetical protein
VIREIREIRVTQSVWLDRATTTRAPKEILPPLSTLARFNPVLLASVATP